MGKAKVGVNYYNSAMGHRLTQRGRATTKLTIPQSPPSQGGDKGKVKYLTQKIN